MFRVPSCPGAMKGPAGPAIPWSRLIPRRTLDREGLGGAGAAGWGRLGGRDGVTRAGGLGRATTRLPAFPPRPPPFSTPPTGGPHDGDVMRRAAGVCTVAGDGLQVCVPGSRRGRGCAPFGAAVYAARAVREAPDRGPPGFLRLLVEYGRRTSKFPKRVLAECVFRGTSCPGAMEGPAGPATPRSCSIPRRMLTGRDWGGGGALEGGQLGQRPDACFGASGAPSVSRLLAGAPGVCVRAVAEGGLSTEIDWVLCVGLVASALGAGRFGWCFSGGRVRVVSCGSLGLIVIYVVTATS